MYKNQKRYNNEGSYPQGPQHGYNNQQRDGQYGGRPYQQRGPRQDEWEQNDRRGPKNQRDFNQRPQTAYNGAPKSDGYSKYNQ